MLNLIARTKSRQVVLILDWQPGHLLAMHRDGSLHEYRTDKLQVDLLEAAARIALNEKQNVELVEQAAAQ
jgi:hypothetical protein